MIIGLEQQAANATQGATLPAKLLARSRHHECRHVTVNVVVITYIMPQKISIFELQNEYPLPRSMDGSSKKVFIPRSAWHAQSRYPLRPEPMPLGRCTRERQHYLQSTTRHTAPLLQAALCAEKLG